MAAFGYWGALTAVRIGLALPAKPVPAQTVIGSGLLVLALLLFLANMALSRLAPIWGASHPTLTP